MSVIIVERLRGVSIIAEDEKTELKRYLLGQLGEPEEERLEMRLVSDPEFVEEFDMMVDEITAAYVAGEFTGEEKERVEGYFLRAPERRQKLEFMTELHDQVPGVWDRDQKVMPGPGFVERIRAFFRLPQLAMAALAIVLMVGGGVWLSRSGGPTRSGYVPLTLAVSQAERNTSGPAPETIKLPANVAELRLELLLPSPPTQSVRYRAEFASPADVRGVTITGQDSRAVVVAVPASELKPDRYVVRLFMIHAEGQEDRVGNYFFRVE